MLLIPCPYCGPRAELEFRGGGQAHIARPAEPMTQSDEAWADMLFYRDNIKGVQRERWQHAHGCGRWFNAVRCSVTDRIVATYRVGEAKPALDGNVPIARPVAVTDQDGSGEAP